MGLSAKAGVFALNTDTGNQEISGVGFTPKIVLFLPTNDTADGVTEHAHMGIGAGVSSSDRCAMTVNEEDAQGTTDSHRETTVSQCIIHDTPGTGTAEYAADFVSQDADGFTINVDTAPGSAKRVGYLALGGTDITNVVTGSFQGDDGVGEQAVTGLGFQPTAILFLNIGSTVGATTNATNMRGSIGWAISSSKRAYTSVASDTDEGTSDTGRQQNTDQCIHVIYPNGSTEGEADFVSFDADGFTVDWGVASASYVLYVALQGGQYDCGTITSQTDTGEFSDTSMSFTGSAIILMSFCNAADAGEVAGMEASLGFATSSSARIVAGCVSEDNQGTTDADSFQDDGACYKNYDFAQGVEGSVDFVSFNADGFTLDQTDADPSANQILWFVIGAEPSYVPPLRRWTYRMPLVRR